MLQLDRLLRNAPRGPKTEITYSIPITSDTASSAAENLNTTGFGGGILGVGNDPNRGLMLNVNNVSLIIMAAGEVREANKFIRYLGDFKII